MSLKPGETRDLAPMGFSFVVRRAGDTSGSESLDLELLLAPNGRGTPIHLHPTATEICEVLSGSIDVYMDGMWKPLKAGERVGVPRGRPHSLRNSSSEPARVFSSHNPALRYGDYVEGLWRIAQSGMVKPGVRNWQTLLALAALMNAFPDEIRSVSPPNFVVRALGTFGTWLGYGP
jgi:quercetin dioxygenase-like cupin family protein